MLVMWSITNRHPNLNLNDLDNLEAMTIMEAIEMESMIDTLPEDLYTKPLIEFKLSMLF